jgi:ABC-2 type transport system permease protein
MNLLRYLRVYGYFIRFSVSRTLEFRLDFFFRVFMDLAYYGINIGFYQVIFLHTELLGGWTRDQTLVFMGGFLLVDAIVMTLFSNNIWWLPILINRGDLDYYLLRPVSSLFFLSVRDFAVNSFINLLFAVGILVWAIGRAADPWTGGEIGLFVVLLMAGAFLHYMVHMLMVLPVFWIQNGSSLHTIFYSFQRFMERPDRIFSGWVRRILISVLPFSLMASFPARILIEGFDPYILLHFFAAIGVFFVLLLTVWNRGLRAYSSASS